MKPHCNTALLAVLLGAALLAGCGQKGDAADSGPLATPMKALTEPQKPAATKGDLDYYSQHLDEALQTWHACQEKGLTQLSDAERATCIAAQTAWHSQPYKPGATK